MRTFRPVAIAALACVVAVLGRSHEAAAQQTLLVLDDFNVDEGHFAQAPFGASGSTNGIADTSTADRVTDMFLEGGGSQKLVLNDDATPGGTARLRHLSGFGNGGTTTNPATTNTRFPTTAGDDGWIGLAVKTDSPGWTVSIYMELSPKSDPSVPSENHGSVPKDVIADGQWNFYQWDLDDFTAGPDGWFSVAGIIGNADSAIIEDGDHSIDSIIFRQTIDMPATATIHWDWLVVSNIDPIVPPAPPVLDADFDDDTDVDEVDFAAWQNGFGTASGATHAGGDSNNDQAVDGDDFIVWQQQFNDATPPLGAVPEPASAALALLAFAALAARRRF